MNNAVKPMLNVTVSRNEVVIYSIDGTSLTQRKKENETLAEAADKIASAGWMFGVSRGVIYSMLEDAFWSSKGGNKSGFYSKDMLVEVSSYTAV